LSSIDEVRLHHRWRRDRRCFCRIRTRPVGTVSLLERESQFGYHSTGRSAAVFLESHGPDVVRALASASKAFFLHPPIGFAEYPLLKPRGLLLIGGHDDSAMLDRAGEECGRYVKGVRRMKAEEARAMVPVLRSDYLGGAMFDPEAMDIDVHSLHHGFLRGLRARGGETVTDAEVTNIEHAPSDWTVWPRIAEFAASVLVSVAGAWRDRLEALAGAALVGLVPKRRTALSFNHHLRTRPKIARSCIMFTKLSTSS
jgi:D-arginine dehydrogenase